MKKTLCSLLAVTMTASLFSACGTQNSANNDTTSSSQSTTAEPIKIVSTIFPIYDWVEQILGEDADNAELTMLLGNGVDLHSYQMTVDDIVTIANCDMFIYVGGQSDSWIDDALKIAANDDMIVVNLLEVLGDAVKEEIYIEGMEHDHDHAEDDDHSHDDELAHTVDDQELDEHVWLSLRHAQTICSYIAEKIGEIDAANAQTYQNNAIAYNTQLSALDAKYQTVVDAAQTNTLLFADRFPFRYLADDYNLDYYAAFPGCSAETEASFETVIFLATKIDELQLNNILVIETSDQSIAQTVKQSTTAKNQEILVFNSLQTITATQNNAGVSYLSMMEDNLSVLENALM